ncbi:glycosyltransferase family 1 protein [Bacillus spongiae]|uniref:Glycosyltransferase family 1 protein n=1 Tax=Bacillus spongiae TaxID=2683610 RepID=A0ABU8HEF0_9BACI
MTEPTRILHVVGAMNRAGTETMLMNLYRKIDRKHIQFDFISFSQQDAHYDSEIKKMGGRVIKLENPQSVKELYHAIKTFGPYQAVHSHTLFHCGMASCAAWLAGVKIRISHAHTTADKSDSFLRKLYQFSMSVMIKRFSTNLLACSKEAATFLFGSNYKSNKHYAYFPNVIDYTDFISQPRQKVMEFKMREGLGNSLVIGHIGRFIGAKNHEFLIEIMKSLVEKEPSIKLLLVGDGDLKHKILEKVQQEGMGDRVHFMGIREDIATILHCMEVFVFPSKYEGLGLVLLEAQACGIPCIVSEAIQPEADIGLGLITQVNLDEGASTWADEILNNAGNKEQDSTFIADHFEKHQYSPSKGIEKLMSLYHLNNGGTYEESINRFV